MAAPGTPPYGGAPPVQWVTTPTWSAPKGYTPDGRRLAGIGPRLLALVIDSLIWGLPVLALAAFLVAGLIGTLASMEPGTADDGPPAAFFGLLLLFYAGAFAVSIGRIVYQAEMVYRRGQTFGHRVARVRVIDARTGGPLSRGRSYGRAFGTLLSNSLYGLGYAWALWEPRRRTFHDMIVDSVVVEA